MKQAIIIISVIVGLAIIFIALGYILMSRIAKLMIKSNFDQRYDDRHTLKYFTVDDFENLKNEPIEFPSDQGQILKGYLYSSTVVDNYKGLLILSHGLGAGHLQYTTEINYFAQDGYLVFAFDDTGCNMSEGEKIKGVTQGLIDLDYALKYINSNPELNKLPKVLFGHSMGAFAVCNITSINNSNIKAIVSLAPFKDEPSMLFEQFRAMTNLSYKSILKILKREYKKRFNSLMSVNTFDSLNKSDIPHMIIAGDKDTLVDYESNFMAFKESFENKENYLFVTAKDRYHRPNLAIDAAKYDQDTNEELQQIHGEYKGRTPQERIDEFYKGLDYDLLVKMDDKIMENISNFLNKCLNIDETKA